MARVLITGAAGFVGANFVRFLLQKNEDEIFVFLRDQSNRWRLSDIEKNLRIIPLDLCETDAIAHAVKTIDPEIVYHFATYGGYPAQYDVPTIVKTNILGSFALMQGLEQAPSFKRLINIGSSSEYGSAFPMREETLIAPNTPYGIAKVAQTFFAQYASRYRNVPAVTLRFFAVYGPYEKPGRLVCDIMLAMARNKMLSLSSPDPRRDFIYMEDIMTALQKAREVPDIEGEIFNVGSGVDYSIGDVVRVATTITGKTVPIKWGVEEKKRIFDANAKWVADIGKAAKHLDWQPSYSLREGLEKTYKWYCDHISLYENPIH